MTGKPGRPPNPKPEEKLVIDEITKEKPLSVLISEIKSLLKPFRNEIDVKILERGGKITEIEIKARIQI